MKRLIALTLCFAITVNCTISALAEDTKLVEEELEVISELPENSVVEVNNVSEEPESVPETTPEVSDVETQNISEEPDKTGETETETEPETATETFEEEAEPVLRANESDEAHAVVVTIESGNSTIEYYMPGEVVTLTVPSKEHYIFQGWEVECDESVTITNNSFVMPSTRVDISAQWQPEEYDISIYYVSDTGRKLHTSDYSSVIYGYEYDLHSDYVLPEIEGYTAYKIVRDRTQEETSNVNEYRSFIMIPNVEEDEIFYVYYTPSEVDFTVNHYLQNLDGSYSEATDSNTYTSTYGSTVESSTYVAEYPGFTWDGVSNSLTLVMSDNALSLYYTRNSYYLYHQVGEIDTEAIEYKYGDNINIADLGTPERVGYTFTGWQTEDGTDVTEDSIQMPAHDLYLVAKWEPANVYYTVRYWVESIDSANNWTASYGNSGTEAGYSPSYDFVYEEAMQAPTGTVITDQAMLDSNRPESIVDAGYTFEKFDENVTVLANGTSVVNVYYRRKVFHYRFMSRNSSYGNYRNHSWTASGINFNGYLYYKYGASLTDFWPETNVRWQNSNGNGYMPPASATDGQDVTLYRITNTNYVLYVKANYQKEDGTYDEGVGSYVDYETYLTTSNTSYWLLDYNSMPAGFDYDVIYTSDGWVTPSGVGERFSPYRISGGDNRTVYIKIKRKGYQITFSNSEEVVDIKSNILYGSSIANMINDVTITKPTGNEDFIFTGFKDENDNVYGGETPEEAYAVFANSVSGKMPAHNVSLTAVWQAPTYTVNFYSDETNGTLISSEEVEYSKLVSSVPENPTKEGYVFINWYYKDGTTEKIFWAEKSIYSDLDLFPKWVRSEDVVYADILVKHNYYDASGNYIQTVEETVQGIVGTTATVNAKEDEGYFPDVYMQNIYVEESGNVVEFNYRQLEEVEYTVKYVDEDGNTLLPDVTKKSSHLDVTETYVYIPRCTPRQISQTIKLTSDPSKNIITFVYDVEGKSSYTVNYYLQQSDGNYALEETVEVNDVLYYTVVTAEVKVYDGYEFNQEKSTTSGRVLPGKNLVFNLYYDYEYHIVVSWDYEDGEYHGGSYIWNCDTLEYTQDTTEAGWSKLPYVKCTVENLGTKSVNLEFLGTVNSWNQYLATNPFENSETKVLGAGETVTFKFTEFDWNFNKLNEEAFSVALGETSSPDNEHKNLFELRITDAE